MVSPLLLAPFLIPGVPQAMSTFTKCGCGDVGLALGRAGENTPIWGAMVHLKPRCPCEITVPGAAVFSGDREATRGPKTPQNSQTGALF